MTKSFRLLVASAVALGAASIACGQDTPAIQKAAAHKIKQLDTNVVPADLMGLKTARENMEESLKRARPSYVESTALYSLRKDDLLLATLQVSKLRKEGDYSTSNFRRAVVNQIGSSAPKAFRMGTTQVWLTTGTKQRISVWFRDQYMFVLASRDDYDQPRTLLRRALEIKP